MITREQLQHEINVKPITESATCISCDRSSEMDICLMRPRDFWPTSKDFFLDSFCLPTNTDFRNKSADMLSILRKARLKDKEMRILML
jgi:hypothetical protein